MNGLFTSATEWAWKEHNRRWRWTDDAGDSAASPRLYRDLSLGCTVLFRDKNRRMPWVWWQRTWLEPRGIGLSCAGIVHCTRKLKFHKSVVWIHEWHRIREMVDYRNIKEVKTKPLVMDVCKRCHNIEMLRMTNGYPIWHLLKYGKNSSETRDCCFIQGLFCSC